jgi:hypothetical protein
VLSYYYWNMRTRGGRLQQGKDRLRRAIAMAHDVDEEIRLLLNGEAQRLPSDSARRGGHDPAYQPLLQYDPVLANQLLDRYGYRKGADGWRTLPDGKPLVHRYTSRNEAGRRADGRTVAQDLSGWASGWTSQRMIFSDIQQAESYAAAEPHLSVAGRLSGRRQFHAAVLRREYRPEQQWLLSGRAV